MKLITLGKNKDSYIIKARKSYKFAGLTFKTTVQEFSCPIDEKDWYNIHGKKISEKNKKLLNSWLKDHQKFIEND